MNEGKHDILPSQIARVAQRWFTVSVVTQGITNMIPDGTFHPQRQMNGRDFIEQNRLQLRAGTRRQLGNDVTIDGLDPKTIVTT